MKGNHTTKRLGVSEDQPSAVDYHPGAGNSRFFQDKTFDPIEARRV